MKIQGDLFNVLSTILICYQCVFPVCLLSISCHNPADPKTNQFTPDFTEGCEDMVPSIEELLACEDLGTLKDNSTFHYLLQVGYEVFNKDAVMSTL